MNPIGGEGRTTLYNIVLILLSFVLAAIVVADSRTRHRILFGSFTGSGIARENIALAREDADQWRIAGPMKQFLVVVLPDGRLVNPRVANQF
jgi:hypothetical protein